MESGNITEIKETQEVLEGEEDVNKREEEDEGEKKKMRRKLDAHDVEGNNNISLKLYIFIIYSHVRIFY